MSAAEEKNAGRGSVSRGEQPRRSGAAAGRGSHPEVPADPPPAPHGEEQADRLDWTPARLAALGVLYERHPEVCWSMWKSSLKAKAVNGRCAQVLVNAGLAERHHELDGGRGLALTLTADGVAAGDYLLEPRSASHPPRGMSE